MITTVLFDMGGTLEDIWVDEASHMAAVETLDRMLKSWGLDTGLSAEDLREVYSVPSAFAKYTRLIRGDYMDRREDADAPGPSGASAAGRVTEK